MRPVGAAKVVATMMVEDGLHTRRMNKYEDSLRIVGGRFLTVEEQSYRYGKGGGWNKPYGIEWNWRYGCKLMFC